MTLYFNHGFVSTYRTIESVRRNIPNLRVIISSNNDNVVYRHLSDKCYKEEELDEEQYIEYLLGICESEEVDVFVPTRKRDLVAKHLERFEEKGIKVLVNSYDFVNLFNDKYAANNSYKDILTFERHTMYKVCTASDFYDALTKIEGKACIKFNVDEGGGSFRIIQDGPTTMDILKRGNSNYIKAEDVAEALRWQELELLNGTRQEALEVLVMPYLDGKEVSIDCLSTSKGFIALTRIKKPGRVDEVGFNKEYYEKAKCFAEHFKITKPFNIQLRQDKGIDYLLEINTRMAGGVYKASEMGIDFASIAIKDMMGVDFDMPDLAKLEAKKIGTLKTAIVL